MRTLLFAVVMTVAAASVVVARADEPWTTKVHRYLYPKQYLPGPPPPPPAQPAPVVAPPPRVALPPIVRPKSIVRPERPKAKPKRREVVGLPPCSVVRREYQRMTYAQQIAAYMAATPEQVAHGRRCLGL